MERSMFRVSVSAEVRSRVPAEVVFEATIGHNNRITERKRVKASPVISRITMLHLKGVMDEAQRQMPAAGEPLITRPVAVARMETMERPGTVKELWTAASPARTPGDSIRATSRMAM